MAVRRPSEAEISVAGARGDGRIAASVALAVASALFAAACGSDLNPKRADARYACSSTADCTTGSACVCGFCQPAGDAPRCLDAVSADASDGADTSSTDATDAADAQDAADAPDTADALDAADSADSADAGGACSPRTWQGCGAGQGCFVDTTGATSCLVTGKGTLSAPCDAQAATPPCGKDGGQPLICDAIEKKCLPLCDATKQDCPKGWQCYPLGTPAWPDHAGVCAP